MNILVFSWRDPKHSNAGGAEQVMHEHMKGWIEAGHSVTFFASRIRGNPVREEVIDGVKIIRRGIQYFGVQIAAFFYYLANADRFDLVVDQFHGLPFFTPFYVFKPKLAVIQEVAGKVWLKNDLSKPLNLIVGIIGYLGEPFLFLFYRNVPFMTGSKSAMESLIKVGINPENITVIPHGTKITKPKPFPAKEKVKTVMFLGSISMDKGIDQALEAFGKINKAGKFKFWVVGRMSGNYTDYLNEKIKELGLTTNLKVFGFVSEEKKFELLARAHVMVNPSVLEGWGLVNIEANAMGTPVVAYNSPGLTDSVKNGLNGIICDKNTPDSMAKNVVELLGNREKYRKLAKGAVGWAGKFTWNRSKKLSLQLIKKVSSIN